MTWLKDLLGGEQVPVGTFLKFPSVEVVEIVGACGFDFVVIDFEHAMLSLSDLNVMIAVARGVGVAPLVRVPDHGYGDVQRILDAGAAGILFPHVSSGAQCEQVVAQASHPPRGTRGAGANMRAGGWAIPGSGADYVAEAATRVMRIPMVEEAAAVDDIDGILAVPGVDGIFIGPGDLAMSMAKPMGDDEVKARADVAFDAAKVARIPVGTVASNGRAGKALVERGFDFILVSSDVGLLAGAARGAIEELRG